MTRKSSPIFCLDVLFEKGGECNLENGVVFSTIQEESRGKRGNSHPLAFAGNAYTPYGEAMQRLGGAALFLQKGRQCQARPGPDQYMPSKRESLYFLIRYPICLGVSPNSRAALTCTPP